MTDRDTMVDQIQAAIRALDEAHAASKDLRERADAERLDAFHARMKALEEHLFVMKQVLEHEDQYTMDEIAERLGRLLGNAGAQASYHRIPQLENVKPGDAK